MCSVFKMLWCHVNTAYCPKTKCGQSHLITNLSSCWTHIKSPKSKPVWSKPHEASQKIRPVCDVRQLLEQIIRIKSRKGQGWRMPRVIIFNTVSMSCWEIRHCRKGQNAKGNMHSNVKNNTSKCGKKSSVWERGLTRPRKCLEIALLCVCLLLDVLVDKRLEAVSSQKPQGLPSIIAIFWLVQCYDCACAAVFDLTKHKNIHPHLLPTP